jgi:hypothetical protein
MAEASAAISGSGKGGSKPHENWGSSFNEPVARAGCNACVRHGASARATHDTTCHDQSYAYLDVRKFCHA